MDSIGIHYILNVTERFSVTNTSEEGKIISSPALGFTGFLGADFPLAKRVTLFGQIGFDLVSFKWKEEFVGERNNNNSRGNTLFIETMTQITHHHQKSLDQTGSYLQV